MTYQIRAVSGLSVQEIDNKSLVLEDESGQCFLSHDWGEGDLAPLTPLTPFDRATVDENGQRIEPWDPYVAKAGWTALPGDCPIEALTSDAVTRAIGAYATQHWL